MPVEDKTLGLFQDQLCNELWGSERQHVTMYYIIMWEGGGELTRSVLSNTLIF